MQTFENVRFLTAKLQFEQNVKFAFFLPRLSSTPWFIQKPVFSHIPVFIHSILVVWTTYECHCFSMSRKIYSVPLQIKLQLFPPYQSLQKRQVAPVVVWTHCWLFDLTQGQKNDWFTEEDVKNGVVDFWCITHICFQQIVAQSLRDRWTRSKMSCSTLWSIFYYLFHPSVDDGM